MSRRLNRRDALRISMATTAAVGIGTAVSGAAYADVTTEECLQSQCQTCAPIPDVPGMLGDARANEFWYQMDEQFYYHPSAEIRAAYGLFSQVIGGYNRVWDLWLASRQAGTYPDSYVALVTPARPALETLSRLQLAQLYDCYYRDDFRRLTNAFIAFGEGSLYDPRREPGERIHTMDPTNGGPPKNYHRWHAIVQATILLGIDVDAWLPVDNLVGLGWAIQSIAKPAMDRPNPSLPDRIVDPQREFWLSRSQEELNVAFETFPYPVGIS